MGDKEHNIKLTLSRQAQREVRNVSEDIDVWIPMLEKMINKDIDNSNEFENIDDINFSGSSDTNVNELDFIG